MGNKKCLTKTDTLGTANNKQIAALLGVAPMNWDSGTMRGKRKIKGGRFAVRNALYMPAMTLISHDPCNKAIKNKYASFLYPNDQSW